MTIGERIKKNRIRKGLTQKQLAEMSDVSEISIRKYESGDRIPKTNTLRKISFALGLKLSDLDKQMLLDEYFQVHSELEKERHELLDAENTTGITNNKALNEINKESTDVLYEIINLKRDTHDSRIERYYTETVLSFFNKLNDKGKRKAISNIEDLTKISEYIE